MNKQATVLIKFTDTEVDLLVNSLRMSISTCVPCVDNGEWKKPYEKIKGDLKRIQQQFKEGSQPVKRSRFDLRDDKIQEQINQETSSRIGQAGCTSGDCD
jgi:hypothetical protein